MRKFLAIIICKLTKKICKYFGRGSSFPGQLALKICPDILSRIDLPENIIAVTGSNGKTSTVEMIHGIIENAGMSVAYNYEGSNQIEGVTTLILSNCSNSGRFEKDVLLIEADERYAKYIFSYITPKYYCINNLYRDQMTRNGHPEYVLNDIEKSVHEGEILVLNADDPLVSSLSARHDNEVVWFGIDENEYVSETCTSVYDDGAYCPVCKKKMVYEYRQFAHVGKYECKNCGFKRAEPDYRISDLDLEKGTVTINDTDTLQLAFHTIFNAYNVLAAYTIGSLLGIDSKQIVSTLNDYLIKNGRIKCGEFLNLENEVDIGAVTHVIDPGGHVVEQARFIEAGHGALDLVGQSRRRGAVGRVDDGRKSRYDIATQLLACIFGEELGQFYTSDVFAGNVVGAAFEHQHTVAVLKAVDGGGPFYILVEEAFGTCRVAA